MSVESSGKLMVRLPAPSFRTMTMAAFSRDQSRALFGSGISEPLFPGAHEKAATFGFDQNVSPNITWVLHEPSNVVADHAWDQAHEFVRLAVAKTPALAEQLFAEPDLLHLPFFSKAVSGNRPQQTTSAIVGAPTL